MKKILSFVLALTLCLSMCACGSKEPSETPESAVRSRARTTVDVRNQLKSGKSVGSNLRINDVIHDEGTDTYTVVGVATLLDEFGNKSDANFCGRFSAVYNKDEKKYDVETHYALYGEEASVAVKFEEFLPLDLRAYTVVANIEGSPYLKITDLKVNEKSQKCTVLGVIEFRDGGTVLQSAEYKGVYAYSGSNGNYSFENTSRDFS